MISGRVGKRSNIVSGSVVSGWSIGDGLMDLFGRDGFVSTLEDGLEGDLMSLL